MDMTQDCDYGKGAAVDASSIGRRSLLAAAMAMAVLPRLSYGQDSGSIRMVVPFAAGGGSDGVARLVADGLKDALKDPVIVENIGGAGGNIGADNVARAKPDGRTLLFTPQSPITISQFVDPKPPFDAEKAFTPVAIVAKTPLVLLIHAGLKATTLQELAAYSKANPQALSYGVASHEFGFTTELLAREAGLQMVPVPYRGSAPAMTDLIGGTIQVLLSSGGAARAQMKDGRVRALAVVGPARSPAFPEVPSTHELGLHNLKVIGWFGLFAPAGTPEAVLSRLTRAATELAANPAYVDKLIQAGYEPLALNRERSLAVLQEHRIAWRSVAPQIKDK